ncbi:hypothetical protein [Dokdonella sp.]|uniref:hypothetical protein n=1 Tax=Dokdonella sp. TaxID=2291710 RepID=UPI003528ABD9
MEQPRVRQIAAQACGQYFQCHGARLMTAIESRNRLKSSTWLAGAARTSGVCTALVMMAVLIGGCADRTGSEVVSADNHAGRMTGYVESRKVTDFCPDQDQRADDERCTVTHGWDYDRGVNIVRTYDPAGKIISEVEPPGADLSLTPAESARVEALVRADPRTRDIVNKPEVMFWAGGFAVRMPGDPWCDRGSRCIRAIAAVDGGNTAILHSVVDLMTDQVVYPDYQPLGEKLSGNNGEN